MVGTFITKETNDILKRFEALIDKKTFRRATHLVIACYKDLTQRMKTGLSHLGGYNLSRLLHIPIDHRCVFMVQNDE